MTGRIRRARPLARGRSHRRRADRTRPVAGGATDRDRHGRSPATRPSHHPARAGPGGVPLADTEARRLRACIEMGTRRGMDPDRRPGERRPAPRTPARESRCRRASATSAGWAVICPAPSWAGARRRRCQELCPCRRARGARAMPATRSTVWRAPASARSSRSCIAMGMDAGQVRRQLDHLLSLEVCGPYFRLVTEADDGPEAFSPRPVGACGRAHLRGPVPAARHSHRRSQCPAAARLRRRATGASARCGAGDPRVRAALPTRQMPPDRRRHHLAGAGPADEAARRRRHGRRQPHEPRSPRCLAALCPDRSCARQETPSPGSGGRDHHHAADRHQHAQRRRGRSGDHATLRAVELARHPSGEAVRGGRAATPRRASWTSFDRWPDQR